MADKCLSFNILNLYYLDDIGDIIGKGSFGTVYIAIRKDDKKCCVVKKIPKSSNVKDMFFAEKFKDCNFAYVAKIYDYYYDKESFNLVMELCKNGSLWDFVNYFIKKKILIEESVFLL
jgi:serine/threonine protein kinase